jgi:hypothetical protein
MQNNSYKFIYRIAVAHTLAYFFAGIFAIVFMNYKAHIASDSLGLLMLPADSPMVALGPGLNILRGIILGFILLSVRTMILGDKGFLKLAILTFGMSFISTIGPAPGSFEGYIYTKLPVQYHLLGIPEALLYVFLFAGILWLWYKSEKKYFNGIAITLVVLILLMSFAGYMQAQGLLN